MNLATSTPRRRFLSFRHLALLAALLSTGLLAGHGQAQGVVTPKRVSSDVRVRIASLPFTIDTCGSYYLSGCLTGVTGQHGVTIDASDVTLDLGGFTLSGVAGSLNGVQVLGAPRNIRIMNGSVNSWGGSGVESLSVRGGVYENLGLEQNGARGLTAGIHAAVTRCFAFQNGTDGVSLIGGAVTDCIAEQNGGKGFAGSGSFARCIASGNDAEGFDVSNASLSDCRSSSNDLDGFKGAGGFTRCQASNNGGDGFDLGVLQLFQCQATSNNVDGIRVQLNSTVSNCTASENDDDGFWVSNQSTIRSSCAINNGADGIVAAQRCQVIDNTVTGNPDRGIFGDATTTIRGNICENNGTGIFTLNGGNRVEANSLIGNVTGLQFNGAGNIALKNTASGNTLDYDLGTGNAAGPIVSVSGTGDISGIADPNHSHPWANFVF